PAGARRGGAGRRRRSRANLLAHHGAAPSTGDRLRDDALDHRDVLALHGAAAPLSRRGWSGARGTDARGRDLADDLCLSARRLQRGDELDLLRRHRRHRADAVLPGQPARPVPGGIRLSLRSEQLVKVGVYFVLTAMSAFMIFPFVWMLVSA